MAAIAEGFIVKPHPSDLFCNDLPTKPQPEIGKILIAGASGYIGGRLVPELLNRGYNVRVMVRASLADKDRWPGVEMVVADVSEPKGLEQALEGIHTAYYLIHSMLHERNQFEAAHIRASINFTKVAEEKKVQDIIYLGGLSDLQTSPSPHFRNRTQVAEELKKGKVPTTILRSDLIIGSGSASYEMIRHLARNCPVLLIPPWANATLRPIAVRDVVKYLVGVMETPGAWGRTFDIFGADAVTFKDLLKTMAGILGKKRLFVPFSISSVEAYAYASGFFTPVPVQISRCLLEGCRNGVACPNDEIRRILPIQVLSYREAIVRALSREDQDKIYTRWSDAYPPAHELAIKLHELQEAPTYTSYYSLLTDKSASALFQCICKIGGKEGWFHSSWLWRLRGVLDRILMGVGTSRGRKSATSLSVNDVIDFWRVEDCRPGERILLRAEMKLPGRAWLEFRIDRENNKNRLSVKAYYQTRGVWGKLYWYVFLPFHIFIFKDLITQIERTSVEVGTN
jgi:uncharacterized protein YbjT (DUF2867 family)